MTPDTTILDPDIVKKFATTRSVDLTTVFCPSDDEDAEPLTADDIHRVAAKLVEMDEGLEEVLVTPLATVIRDDGTERLLTFDQLNSDDDIARALVAAAAEVAALQRKFQEAGRTFIGLLRTQRRSRRTP